MQVDNCVALITGASAGIGREFARLLAPRARTLILIARRSDRLEEAPRRVEPAQLSRVDICLRGLDLNQFDPIFVLSLWLKERRVRRSPDQ